jgi:branched-chain amino acid transport system substrate-binding protein
VLPVAGDVIVAGVSIALSGPLALQGREAVNGLRLWAAHVRQAGGLAVGGTAGPRPLRLVVLDDESHTDRAKANVTHLLDEAGVALLLGPYGSHLVLGVAPLTEARGRLLWNHGGTADPLWDRGFRRLVSVASPASDYFRALPALLRRRDPALTRIVVVYSERGAFAPAVTGGVVAGARAAGCEPVRVIPFAPAVDDLGGVLDRARAHEPDVLVGAGRFADDVTMARQRHRLAPGTRVALVAAGIDAFGREAGDAAEGVIGPSQWEPDDGSVPPVGPPGDRFTQEYRRAFGQVPGYVAAQAYALGLVIAACTTPGGSMEDDALLLAARTLHTATFFGGFRLEPSTLRQVGHRVRLVEWRRGRKVPLERPAL